MAKIYYYMFDVHNPYRCGGECYKTLVRLKLLILDTKKQDIL